MPTPPIAWYADKDQGPRADNQDAVLVLDQNDTARRNAKGVLLILCDGVGGEKGGQRASSLASDTAFNAYYSESGPPQQALQAAIEKANQAVRAAAAADQSIKNMATTIVAMAVINDKLYVSHVGDSRGYLLRDGELNKLTKDHSWVAEQVERGMMTPQEARVSNQRNIITRSLGAAANHTPDINADPITLQPGDRIMICSDGLHGAVTDEQITAIMQRNPSPQKAVTTLIKAANDNHTTDNISCIVFNYGAVAAAAAAAKGLPIPLVGAIAGILVVLVAAVLVIGAMSTNNNQNPTKLTTATATRRPTHAANGTAGGADIPEVIRTVTDTTMTPEGTPGPATVTPDLRNSPTPVPIIATAAPSATPTLQPTIGPTQAPTDTPKPNQPKPADTPKPANTSAPAATNTTQPPPTNTPQPPPTNTPQPPPTNTPQPPPTPEPPKNTPPPTG